MSKYQEKTTKEIVSFNWLKRNNPNTSMRDGLTEILNYHIITKTGQPDFDSNTQRCVEIAPVDYVQTWEVQPLSQQEINDRLVSAKEKKLDELSTLALEKEEADIDINGTIISAKREDQFRMTQALSLMSRKSTATKIFKAKNGWGEVNKATLEAMQDALEAQIDAVTTQHEAHENAILALTTASQVESYDITTGW